MRLNAASNSFVHIVDDDLAVLESLSSLMFAAGLDNACYDSGNQFLAGYCDRGPACIVMDICMPGISGLQLLERLHTAGIHHPVIMVTGYGEIDLVVRAFRQGAADFFEKPISGPLLLDQVQRSIERDREDYQRRQRVAETREQLSRLSKREADILTQLIKGKPNKAIAYELNLSEKTIAAHRTNLLAKMEADSLPQVITRIASSGLKFPDDNDTVAA